MLKVLIYTTFRQEYASSTCTMSSPQVKHIQNLRTPRYILGACKVTAGQDRKQSCGDVRRFNVKKWQ